MAYGNYTQVLHVFCREFRQDCFGRTVSSTPFSRKAASYCSRPRLRSQLATSMTAPKLSFEVHHRPGERPCPGHRAEASSVVGLKGPPRRTELALFPNLVSWLLA